jgi:hypothetical protein
MLALTPPLTSVVPLAVPDLHRNLVYASAAAARQLDGDVGWQASRIEADHFGGGPRHARSSSAPQPLPSAVAANRPGADRLSAV